MSLISVIVPVYKVEISIDKCIKSILSQTYRNLEIILVNDGSPDNSGNICDYYAQIDGRIKVVHQANLGLSMARNNGLKLISGDYVSFIDSDDCIAPEMYENMLDVITKYDLDVVECTFKINGEVIYGNPEKDGFCVQSLDQALTRLHYKSFFNVTNKLYSVSVIKGLQFPKGKIFEDIHFSSQVWKRISQVGFLPQPYYDYSQEGESIQRSSYNLKKIEGLWVIHEAITNFLELVSTEESVDILRKNLLKNLMINFHLLIDNISLDPSKKELKKMRRLIRANFKFTDKNVHALLIGILPLQSYIMIRKINQQRKKVFINS